jgi:hypothetical protein
MNQFFVVAIADFFERRSAAASKTKADKAWAKAGSKRPMPDDCWTKP